MQRQAKALSKMSPSATTITLVRHGETSWNVDQRLQGQSGLNPGLNDNGVQQAQQVRRPVLAQQQRRKGGGAEGGPGWWLNAGASAPMWVW